MGLINPRSKVQVLPPAPIENLLYWSLMNPLEIIGIVSALLTLSAFIMNQYGILQNDDIRYDMMNMISGIGLVIYAVSIHGVPFILTNTVWAIVSGIDVGRYFLKRPQKLVQ